MSVRREASRIEPRPHRGQAHGPIWAVVAACFACVSVVGCTWSDDTGGGGVDAAFPRGDAARDAPVTDARADAVSDARSDVALEAADVSTEVTPEAAADMTAIPEAGDAGNVALDATMSDAADGQSMTSFDASEAADIGTPLDAVAASDATDAPSTADGGVPLVRLAHLVRDFAAVDFCIAPAGLGFGTPYMQSVGVATGLAYTAVSEYAPAPVGAYSVRVVAAGSTACDTALPGISDVAVAGDGPTTVALMGLASGTGASAPALRAYPDDDSPTTPQSAAAWVRVIPAVPDAAPIDIELGAGNYAVPMQNGVAYGATFTASTQAPGSPTPDSAGYIAPAIAYAQFTAKLLGAEVTSFADTWYARMSAFFVDFDGDAGAVQFGFVACDDAAASQGHLSTCKVRPGPPQFSPLRLANFAPDAPLLDVCLQINGAWFGGSAATLRSPLRGPLLAEAGLAGGISPLQVTGVVTTVPQNTLLTIDYVPAGGDCSQAPVVERGFGAGGLYDVTTNLAALVESQFAPDPYYGVALESPTSTPLTGEAIFEIAYAAGGLSETIDIYETPEGGSESRIEPSASFAGGPVNGLVVYSAVDGFIMAPGTYGLRVADHGDGGTLYSTPAATFADDSYTGLYWIQDSPGHGGLVRCDLTQVDPSARVDCVE
jgi:hypothetical protein